MNQTEKKQLHSEISGSRLLVWRVPTSDQLGPRLVTVFVSRGLQHDPIIWPGIINSSPGSHLPTRISCEMLAGIFVSPVAHVDTNICFSLFFSGNNALFTETCRSCRHVGDELILSCTYDTSARTAPTGFGDFTQFLRVLLKSLRFRNLSWGPPKKNQILAPPRTFPPRWLGDLAIWSPSFCLLGLILVPSLRLTENGWLEDYIDYP